MKPLNHHKFKLITTLLLLAITLGQVQPGYAQIYRNDESSPVIGPSYTDPNPLRPPADFLNNEQQQKPDQIDKGLEEALAILLQALVMPIRGDEDIKAEISSIIDRYLSEETSVEEKDVIIRELARTLEYDAEKQRIFVKLYDRKCRGRKEVSNNIAELYRRCVEFSKDDLTEIIKSDNLDDRIRALIIELGKRQGQNNELAKQHFEQLVSPGSIVLPHLLKAIVYGNENVKKWSRLALNKLWERDSELGQALKNIIREAVRNKKSKVLTNNEFAVAIKKSGIIEAINIDYLIDKDILTDIDSLNTSDDSVLEKKLIAASESLTSGKRLAKYVLMNAIEDNDIDWRRSYYIAKVLIKTGESEAIVVPALLEALKDENRYVRHQAARVLCKIKDKKAVPALIKALKDENEFVRFIAARVLCKIKDKKAVPALIELLQDENVDVVLKAREALHYIGKEAVPALIKALKADSWRIRGGAAKILGRIGDSQAVSALINALKDKYQFVRYHAAEALGRIKDKQAVPALIKALEDKDKMVRYYAAEALGEIGEDAKAAASALIQTLGDEDPYVRSCAVRALIGIGQAAKEVVVPLLIQGLRDKNPNIRVSVIVTLSGIGAKEAAPALIQALKDESPSVREAAAYSLRKIKTKEAVRPLIEALKDENSRVRYCAAIALSEIGAKEAVPALIQALGDETRGVRANAAVALGKIGQDTAVPALIELLHDESVEVIRKATEALSKIGKNAVPALMKALKDENISMRGNAIIALGKIGEDAKAAVPALINLLKDKDEDARVRENAALALGDIKDKRAVPVLITEALKSEVSNMRICAAVALSKIGDPRTIEILEGVSKSDHDPDMRKAATRAIARIKEAMQAKNK